MTAGIRRVFEPLDIAGVRVPNRVVRTAHLTKMGIGTISDDLIDYHVSRARGGVGLSILEATAVHPSSVLGLVGYTEAIIPTYRRLMDAIRPHGMKMFQQLWHGGHIYPPPNGLPMRGASALPSPAAGLPPVPIATDEVAEFVQAYADAARRSVEGGIDGIEIAAGHGYLVQQFLSPLTNTRTDRYGGSLENRMRFLAEILTAVRAEIGAVVPLGIRIGASRTAGGVTEQEVTDVVHELVDRHLIDFVDVTMGDYYQAHWMMGGMDRPAGYMLPSSGQVTDAVTGVARIVTGRFRTLEEVEQVLRSGQADLVSMVRAHIADPDLVRKTRAGRGAEVRPCIGCNQGCIARTSGVDLRLGCTVNPAIGRERSDDDAVLAPAATVRRVVIVGGGPAGLEAARVARTRGHEVDLFEAQDRLGGVLNVARRAPRTQGLDDIVEWYRDEMRRLGVRLHLARPVSAEEVVALQPDTVVVATGAEPSMDGRLVAAPGEVVAGIDAQYVMSSVDVLGREAPPAGSRALVFDDIGQYEAVSVVEYLLAHGVHVTAATRLAAFGSLVDAAMRMTPALERLYAASADLDILTRTTLSEAAPGKATLRSLVGAPDAVVRADIVVVVSYKKPRAFVDGLAGRVADVRVVGDALAARDLQVAIREGNQAGRDMA
jgi:2,4-dienoyl-CoA reductase-like NADH-dependent reductase (Old Yellow Enzyme family)